MLIRTRWTRNATEDATTHQYGVRSITVLPRDPFATSIWHDSKTFRAIGRSPVREAPSFSPSTAWRLLTPAGQQSAKTAAENYYEIDAVLLASGRASRVGLDNTEAA
jgi:hypothetical protein